MPSVYPVTCFTIGILCAVHFIFMVNNELVYDVMSIPNMFLQHLAATFVHGSAIHLFQNCLTMYRLRSIELVHRSTYLNQVLYFVVMNSLLWYLANELVFMNFSVGFSGVLFGLITLYPYGEIMGISINPALFPFAMLFLMQLLVPSASLAGHFIGIVSAYIYMFVIGV